MDILFIPGLNCTGALFAPPALLNVGNTGSALTLGAGASVNVDGVGADHIQPVGIVFTANSKTAFIALGPANRVAVIDMTTGAVLKYVLVGQRVWHLALTPEDDMLFTTNGISGDVTAIDTRTLRAVKSIKVGRYPWGVAIRPTP